MIEIPSNISGFAQDFVNQAVQGNALFFLKKKQVNYHYIESEGTPTFLSSGDPDASTNKDFSAYILNRYPFFEIDDRNSKITLSVLEGRREIHQKKCNQDLCSTYFLLRFAISKDVFLTFIPCSQKALFRRWSVDSGTFERSIPTVLKFPTKK